MSDGSNVAANTKYKDRLFNYIFGREENREWTLSLYNAVNHSNYTDPSVIEFNTLEDVLYLGMRNDTSFLITEVMSVYEHQSTYNPNMPVRLLGYVDELYSGYISRNKLNKYGDKLIKLPVPKLVVFYNGQADKDDELILRLSDSFSESHRQEADIEVRVRMLNVNLGRNNQLMENCKPLAEYAWFVAEVRHNRKKYGTAASIKRAIDSMPNDYTIKNFLIGHLKEVEGMLERDYNEEEVMELFKKDYKEEGRDETIITLICKKLIKGKTVSEIAEAIEEPEEKVSEICKIASKYFPDYDINKIMSELEEIRG